MTVPPGAVVTGRGLERASMFACYHDIMSKLGCPLWFDENAVPRYCEFHPHYLANIYADEAVLLHVGCQVCHIPFI